MLGSYETDGILNLVKLKENIANNIKDASHNNADNFPLIVTYTATGHAYKVESDGTVSKNIGLSLDKEEITFRVVNGVVQSPTTEKITATLQGITGTVNWSSDDENEEVISLIKNENELTVTANGIGNAVIIAKVKVDGGEVSESCNVIVEEMPTISIEASVNNLIWGSVEINEDGPYIEGMTVNITPTAKNGYRFKKWTDESGNEYIFQNNEQYTGITVSATGILTYEVQTSKHFTAIFEKLPVAFKNPDYNNPIGMRYYGTTVATGVTEVNGVSVTDNWKIFFADKDYVYLIYGYGYYPYNAQVAVTGINLKPGSYMHGVNGTSYNNLIKYLKNNSNYTNNDYSMDASAPNNGYDSWKRLSTAFASGNDMAKKLTAVQGSPNLEMWIASWNELVTDETEKLKSVWDKSRKGLSIMFEDGSSYNNSGVSVYVTERNTLFFPVALQGASNSYRVLDCIDCFFGKYILCR